MFASLPIALLMGLLITACAGHTRAELAPTLRTDLEAEALPTAFADALDALTPAAPRHEPGAALEICTRHMDALERRVMAHLRALDEDTGAQATTALREVLRDALDAPAAPLRLEGRGFAFSTPVLRVCAEAARVAGEHALAQTWLGRVEARGELGEEDRRRLAWSRAELGQLERAIATLEALPAERRSERDEALLALWRHELARAAR